MLRSLTLLGCLLLLALPSARLLADDAPVGGETAITADPTPTPATGTRTRDISVTFRTGNAGHLVRSGAPLDLAAVITSPITQQADITLLVTTAFGAQVHLSGDEHQPLEANTPFTFPIDFPGARLLPRGYYRVEVWAEGEKGIGYEATGLNVWEGPAAAQTASMGISYQAPLNDARTWSDLDLFKAAGVGWMRFPLRGWLPQGQAVPDEAVIYDKFVQEAGQRGFSLLAACTPRMTVDPSVDATQADKEYRESLMAAVNRYSFKVRQWELLSVKPDPRFRGFQGVGSAQLTAGEKAIKGLDKDLGVIFSLEAPFRENTLDLLNHGMPGKGDALGMLYDYASIPEVVTTNAPPLHALGDMLSEAERVLKRKPPVWVTEHGFNPSREDKLPEPPVQAALMARALLINRALNIQQTFWRHDVTQKWDQPFILPDGSTSPKYLALRTVLEKLNGVTGINDVVTPMLPSESMPRRVWAFVMQYGGTKEEKRGFFGTKKKGGKARYCLVVWWETRDPRVATSITVKTTATRLTVTDLWGNTEELQPVSQGALVTVDAFPRFIDLGEAKDPEILSPFARFDPPALILTEGGKNIMGLQINNDQRLFRGKITCDVVTRRWPGTPERTENEVNTQQLELGPGDHYTLQARVDIPEGARMGQLFEIASDIMLGTRRIGYLTLPVYYMPKEEMDKLKPTDGR